MNYDSASHQNMATAEQFAPRERSNSFEKFRLSEPRLDDLKERKRHTQEEDEHNDDKKYDMHEHYEDEDDEPIDPSVKEDMKRLEDTFTGISKRFRLINRIGEGTKPTRRPLFPRLTVISFRHIFNRVQSRRYTVRSLHK